ncbi:hypothetical protein LOTGIDRAFT_234466 [Lottia gigantea]|uniref:Uncharacterized protein n=1 Tax=Lottia gigantea TaxID=225164 RepID=V4A5P1_LOTGI|nr:hypothetical protein LOTGIDRAFT_234466 [Lottia gigantea]ESO88581.1 hypothetical protein LOTGIDRAFT_234466 [Lottia gigantea]
MMTGLRIETERVLFPCVVAITGVGLVLQLLGLFLPYWYIIDLKTHYWAVGFFHSIHCKYGRCVNAWYGHRVETWLNGQLRFTAWIQTVAVIFGVLGFITSIIQMVNRRRGQMRKNLSHTAFFLFTLPAGFLALVGVIVYISEESPKTGGDNGWCYILSLLAGILLLLSALLSCVWCRDQGNDYDERLAARYLYTSTRF